MIRFGLAVLAVCVMFIPVQAAGINGQYVEARTCDVWTGPCFANADFNLSGKNAVMAWRIDKGSVGDVALDGLGVAAVVSAQNTLGLEQSGPARVVILVDKRATSSQQDALVRFAKKQGGKLLAKVASIQPVSFDLTICECKGGSCAMLKAGGALIQTRCIHAEHDKVCGNESAYYPPLASNVNVRAAAAVEHSFQGTGLRETWRDFGRRGAYVGSFAAR